MIEIYGKKECNYCLKAKSYLDVRNLEYTYKELDTDFNREEMMDRFPTAKSYPQVRINNKTIGTFDQMVSYIETMGYK